MPRIGQRVVFPAPVQALHKHTRKELLLLLGWRGLGRLKESKSGGLLPELREASNFVLGSCHTPTTSSTLLLAPKIKNAGSNNTKST